MIRMYKREIIIIDDVIGQTQLINVQNTLNT